jgi:hypothetical protein
MPLYSYSDENNRLATSVSINYVGGNGIRTSDLPSCVGSGWGLAASGVITRIQHGEPDDQLNDQYSWSDYNNYYPNGYLYSQYNASDLVNNAASFLPVGIGEFNIWPEFLTDREIDMFSFSFNGRSGEFFFDKYGNIRTVVDSKLKIEKVTTNMTSSNIRTRISEFQITDETGIKYVFKDLELNQIVFYDDVYSTTYYYPDSERKRVTKLTKGRAVNQYVVSKWFLTKIINPLTSVEILFNYETYPMDMDGEKTIQKSTAPNGDEYYNMTVPKIKGISKRLTSIEASAAEKVEFTYVGNRYDLPFDKILDQVLIKYREEVIVRYQLQHEYFFMNNLLAVDQSMSSFEKHQTRLSLKSVQKFGSTGESEPPYLFEYNLGDPVAQNDIVPPIYSVFHDEYGYGNLLVWPHYNPSESNYSDGSTTGLGLAFSPLMTIVNNTDRYRGVSANQAKTGALKSVQYPQGGNLSFEYVQNTSLATTVQQVGGVHVSKTISYDGIDHARDIVTEYKYVLSDNTTTSGWGYESFVYSNTTGYEIHKCGSITTVMSPKVPGTASSMPGSTSIQLPSGPTVSQFFISAAIGYAFNLGVAVLGLPPIIVIPIEIVANIIIQYFSDPVKTYNTTVYFSHALNSSVVLPTQFSRVEVSSKIGSENNGLQPS